MHGLYAHIASKLILIVNNSEHTQKNTCFLGLDFVMLSSPLKIGSQYSSV